MSTSSSTPSVSLTAETIAFSLRHTPSAPKVLPLLKRHLSNGNAPLQQIVDLVRLDPGIAARVLQTANSALFSAGNRCNSVEFAVNRIGFDRIFEIVANAVAEQVLVHPLTAYSIEADDFWSRSVACGIAAETLANCIGEDVNVAYTLGLLHGVGMVAINQWAERNAPTLGFFSRGFPRDASDSERSLLGCTNAEVGATILRQWEFPAEMSEPLRWQYAPLDSLAYRKLNCTLYAARWISARVCTDSVLQVASPDNRLLAPIGFTAAKLVQLVPDIRTRLDEVERSLNDFHPSEAA
jgi:HD-like signal output (HDOD) protein